jgi:SAM-dependent methyltransferase
MPNGMTGEILKEKLKQYQFYHVIQLDEDTFTPGVQQYIPLQQKIHNALASLPLQGKRVLDIGCRDGLFCFEAENMGAKEVIGIDNNVSIAATEFLIPYFDSKVNIFELNVYDLTPEIYGMFDVIIFAGVLYHLRYPFWALKRVRDVVVDHGKIIIETGILDAWDTHALLFCPTGAESPYEPTSVAFFNTKGLIDTLFSLGITVRHVDYLHERAIKKSTLALKSEPEIELGMPINRATLVCERTPEILDADRMKYWEHTHAFHTTGRF